MIVSDARRAANQRNALKSTGPKSAAGKDVVRRNALKHGLTALVVPVEEEAAIVQERLTGLARAVRPRDAWQAWVIEEMARVAVRLDRLVRVERQVRAEGCWRALTSWDGDQREEVERVATRLRKDPSRVVGWLRRSPQGCDWMIERWAMLASVADQHPWTDEQIQLAYDMMGTPPEVREDAPGRVVDAEGLTCGPERSESEVARAMVADLVAQRDRVVEADEVARSRAEADCDEFGNRDLVRLRRYERDLQRRLRWYFDLIRRESPTAMPHPCRAPDLADPALLAPIPAESKPLAGPDPAQNKPIPAVVGGETNPLAARENPAATDPPAPPVANARSRPLTAFELWSWERGEADRALREPGPGRGARASVVPITAGRRGIGSGDDESNARSDRDPGIHRRTRVSGLGGSSLAGKCRSR